MQFKEYILNGIITVLTRGAPILVMPLLTNGLSLNEYGLFAIYIVVINLLAPIITGNLPAGIMREGVLYYQRGFKLLHLVCVYSAALFMLAIGSWFVIDIDELYLFLFLLIVSAAHQECIITYFRANYRDYSYLSLSIFRALSLVIPAVFVAYELLDLHGFMEYYCLGYLLTSLMFTPIRIWGYSFSLSQLIILKSALAYSVFLIPYAVGQWIMSSSSRALLGYISTEENAGLFAIAYTLASPVIFLFSVAAVIFSRSIIADFKSWIEDHNYRQRIVAFMVAGSCICTAVSLCIIYIDYLTVQWINYYARELMYLTGVISLSLVFHCMYSVYGNMLFYLKATKVLAKNSVFVGILHVAHSYYFIGTLGIVGAAYSVWISYFLTYVLTLYNVIKITGNSFKNVKIDVLILFFGVLVQVVLVMYFDARWLNIYIN